MNQDSTESRQPWDRLDNESVEGWAAFQAFLELPPPRKLRTIAEQLGRSRAQMKTYSGKYDWQRRARLWDDHVAKVERLAELEARVQTRKSHVVAARRTRKIGVASLNAIYRKMQRMQGNEKDEYAKEFTLLSHRETLAFLMEGVELERDLAKEDIEREVASAGAGGYDTTKLSEEQLTTFLGLLRIMEAGGTEGDE